MTALSKIQQAGFNLSMNESGSLVIVPASKLTDDQRQFLKSHKAEIVQELREAANDSPKYQRFTATDRTGKVYESITGEPMTVKQYRELWPRFVKVEGVR